MNEVEGAAMRELHDDWGKKIRHFRDLKFK